MSNERLIALQAELHARFGFKIDVYHSEDHRGILVVRHGAPLTPFNVIHAVNY